MIDTKQPLSTLALRDEVLRLEEELNVRQWQEHQLAISDGRAHAPDAATGLIVEIRTFDYTNGDRYEGEALDTLRHGEGRHACSNGDTYEGAWRYDKRHGRGTATFARGLRYEGQWHEDLAQGLKYECQRHENAAQGTGKASYENGATYEGDFKKDHRWGWGLQRFPNGSTYEGEWFDDMIEGRGRFSYPDGSFFEGELGNGRRVQGRFVSADGETEYEGRWRDDLQHGAGMMAARGAWKYTGQWMAGLQHGHGVCEYAGGLRYEGGWAAGLRQGRGTLRGPNYQYEGEWRDDRQHGEGSCLLESGDKYRGGWSGGRCQGAGSCLSVNGDRYQGEWRDGCRSGEGACEYKSGDTYQGAWAADRRHGFGRCTFADGTRFRGRWEDDGWVQSAADPRRSRLLPPRAPMLAVAGRDATLTIQARDDLGNQRLTGGDEFVAELRGPSSVFATLVDGGDGSYAAAINATTAGDHLLHVTLGGEDVGDSPLLMHVAAAEPAPRRCTVTGGGRSAAVCGAAAVFTVEIRDQFGNRCCTAEALERLALEVELRCGGGGVCAVAVAPDAAAGAVACSYTPAAPGAYRLQLTSRGTHLAGSPHSVRVNAAEGAAEDAAGRPGEPAAVRDESQLWRDIAAVSFAADGVADGWDSDDGAEPLTKEDKYLRANPGVPVVENLEDLWMVSKLQGERKAREAAQKKARLAKMREALQQQFGDPVAAPLPAALQEKYGVAAAAQEDSEAPALVPIPTRLPAC